MGSIIRVLILMSILFLLSGICYGQTAAEFFRQKKTQEKYLLKQIAYLELYAGYLRQGYDIARSGLQTIKGFTSGEFRLHQVFIDSLSLVNPLIKKDDRVLQIALMQVKIGRAFSLALKTEVGMENLSYLSSVKEGVISECIKDLDELLLVITASKVQMNDQRRLSRLAEIHNSVEKKLEFVVGLYAQVKELEQAIKNEQSGISKTRRLYENN